MKPKCKLIGVNDNIFNLLGIASKTLETYGMAEDAAEMRKEVFASKSYEEALCIIAEYVEVA